MSGPEGTESLDALEHRCLLFSTLRKVSFLKTAFDFLDFSFVFAGLSNRPFRDNGHVLYPHCSKIVATSHM